MNLSQVVLIIRGCSGSTKTTFANYIKSLDRDPLFSEVCCADDYYTNKYGSYKWNAKEIGAAHSYCRNKFENALRNFTPLVIVANTSTTTEEIQPYIDLAIKHNYSFFSIVMENRNDTKDIHNLPLQTLVNQELKLRANLKLR